MLGRNTWSTLLHVSKNIIHHWCTGLGGYIVDLFWIGNINKDMSPFLLWYMWMEPFININKKSQHPPSTNHTNGSKQIMGTTLSGYPMKATNPFSLLKTEDIHKIWLEIYLLCDSSQPHHASRSIHIGGSTVIINKIHIMITVTQTQMPS